LFFDDWHGLSCIISIAMSDEAAKFRKQADEARQQAETAISLLDREGCQAKENGPSTGGYAGAIISTDTRAGEAHPVPHQVG
jgi:hypothetical protein